MLDVTTPGGELNGPPAAPLLLAGPPQPVAARHRWLWATLAIVVVAGAGSGWWWWHSHHPAQQAQAAPPAMKVPVFTVVARTVPIYRSFPATTEAIRSVLIQARVTGYLVQQGAPDGADVAQDALLYRVDARDYEAALAQATGQRDRSIASLSYSQVSQTRNQILARDGWTSRDTSDQATSTNRQNQAGLASDTAAMQTAALNLSRTAIRAPFAGRISRSQVFEGSLISVAGTTLNTLVQLDPIYVSFSPAEANLGAITRTQAQAPIETSVAVGGGTRSHDGKITFIDNTVDRATGTILLRATIANPDRGLLPGQYVTARLHLGDLDDALLVPQSAVGSGQTGRYLLIIGKDGKAEQHAVKLGDSDGDMIVVTDGLKPGDRVITGQLQKLKPGAPVEAAEPPAGQAK